MVWCLWIYSCMRKWRQCELSMLLNIANIFHNIAFKSILNFIVRKTKIKLFENNIYIFIQWKINENNVQFPLMNYQMYFAHRPSQVTTCLACERYLSTSFSHVIVYSCDLCCTVKTDTNPIQFTRNHSAGPRFQQRLFIMGKVQF